MKKIIFGSLLLALIGIATPGCEKIELSTTENEIYSSKSGFNWSTIDYEEIGRRHNTFMIQAFEIHHNTGKKGKALQSELDFDIEDNVQSSLYDSIHSGSIDSKNNLILSNISSDARKVYLRLRDVLYSAENYNELTNQFDSIKATLSRFQGLDYGILMNYVEVGKASAYLWFPVSEGGSGLGDEYLENSDLGRLKAAKPPRTAVENDVLGGAHGMVGWALTGGATFGPWGALGGFIAGTVIGAVQGSLFS